MKHKDNSTIKTKPLGFHLFSKKLKMLKSYESVIFLFILGVGLYLRFWHIQEALGFGFDQARDAWMMRNILSGHLTLIGPKTGVGYMHTGPLYYYFLAPFYYFSNLDPMASNYFNILENIINFLSIYYVSRKIFNSKAGLFATFLYAVNLYLIHIGRIEWNVSLMPGVAALIFYSLYKVYQGQYKWIFVAWTLSGFSFNIHFTALFFPLIVLLSLIFVKNKKKAFLYSLYSIPLYVIWFIPNIIYQIQGQSMGFMNDFLKYYFVGFHLQFLLYRLPFALVMFKLMIGIGLFFKPFTLFEYLIPVLFIITVIFFEKDKANRIFAYLCSLWIIIPLIGFTLYGGTISEYYFLYEAPIVIFIFIYLQNKLLQLKYKKIIIAFLILVWTFYAYQNTKDEWIKPDYGGLLAQKDTVKNQIKSGQKINYNEGSIESYLYQIMIDQKKKK